MMRYHGVGWGEGLLVLAGLLLLVALIVIVVWVFNRLTTGGQADRGGPREASRSSAHDILRERFARGEITEEQFEQARKVLDRDR